MSTCCGWSQTAGHSRAPLLGRGVHAASGYAGTGTSDTILTMRVQHNSKRCEGHRSAAVMPHPGATAAGRLTWVPPFPWPRTRSDLKVAPRERAPATHHRRSPRPHNTRVNRTSRFVSPLNSLHPGGSKHALFTISAFTISAFGVSHSLRRRADLQDHHRAAAAPRIPDPRRRRGLPPWPGKIV